MWHCLTLFLQPFVSVLCRLNLKLILLSLSTCFCSSFRDGVESYRTFPPSASETVTSPYNLQPQYIIPNFCKVELFLTCFTCSGCPYWVACRLCRSRHSCCFSQIDFTALVVLYEHSYILNSPSIRQDSLIPTITAAIRGSYIAPT